MGFDSWLARAIEGGGRGRVGIEVFEGAGRRSGLGVDGAPRARDSGGAFDVVTAAGNTGETEVDTGGKQVDGNRVHSFAVNDCRAFAVGRRITGNNGNHSVRSRCEAGRRVIVQEPAGVTYLPDQRAVRRRIL